MPAGTEMIDKQGQNSCSSCYRKLRKALTVGTARSTAVASLRTKSIPGWWRRPARGEIRAGGLDPNLLLWRWGGLKWPNEIIRKGH